MLGFCGGAGWALARTAVGQKSCAVVGRVDVRTVGGCVRPRAEVRGWEFTRCWAKQEAADEEDDFEDEEDGIVVLRDEETNKTLECIIERTVTVEGNEYFLCSPCDDPVIIATMEKQDGESALATVDEPDVLKKLFSPAAEVLGEDGVTLQDTAYIWTVIPEIDEDEDGAEDEEDEEDEEGKGAEVLDLDGEEEEVEVIAEFFHEGSEYFIAKTVAPVFFVTKNVGGEMIVPQAEELERISATIEDELEKEWALEEADDSIETLKA